MKPYIVIVHKTSDSAYGMTFPDAPGCFSAADELDDLFANATEALELWVEGMIDDQSPIPQPRDLEDLKADPQWVEHFSGAALVIAVQPPQVALNRAA